MTADTSVTLTACYTLSCLFLTMMKATTAVKTEKEAANLPLLKSHQVHSGQDIRNGTNTTQDTANLRIREEKNGGSTDIWGQWDSSTCERKVEGRTR